MKKSLLFLSGIMLCMGLVYAQEPSSGPTFGGVHLEHQDEISDELRAEIQTQIDSSILALQMQGRLYYSNLDAPDDASVKFSWPIKMKDGTPYQDIWAISNYVDHQSGSGIKDYNCGQKTYNGHMGTDIFLWPFYWYAMDHDQGEIVAGAAGQIIFKHDGEFDRSCVMGGGMWNAVYIQHSDGSVAWYGHMKKNSLTSKVVGDMVTEGEFLGRVGSSGNSTGPHLHFELHDENGNLIDPYQGSCNDLNSESRWIQQRAYKAQKINAVATHSAPPVFQECPQTEIPNFRDFFDPGQDVVLGVYLIDQMPGESFQLKVISPDGSYLYNWTSTPASNADYASAWWYWTINPTAVGEYIFQVSYGDQVVSHNFFVGQMGVNENEIVDVKVYPNPTLDIIRVDASKEIVSLSVVDLNGKQIQTKTFSSKTAALDLSGLPSGVYLLQIKTNQSIRIHKIIKK